ncbi:flagellar basal-body MS-ring/collar protein FliF [Gorillibacterium sp. sgz5001074]|uniref:flagellar basal-body MS-ring/collar protein FliF n=1 Tax=Gorillibacterium sp. sgz5001074 TaxID=3446695 RepID=UPI003F6644C4
MNERLLQNWTNLKQFWNKFNRTYKFMIVGTIVLTIAIIGLVIYNNSKIEYATAFTDLQPTDASNITKYLTDSGIPYRMSTDGKTIGVPRNMVSQVKVDVVGKGLSKSGAIGWGVFRESNMLGLTNDQTRIMELEALQGELEQLINTNVAVASSKVLVTQPGKNTVFIRDKEPPTASVVLNTKPGYTLDQQKIDTMYLLVSKSVPNLVVENITISDQNGDLLPYSKLASSVVNAGNAAAQQFQIKREFERDLRKEIMSMLGQIVGQDRVVPMVVATLNFDKKKTSSDLVKPVNGESGIVVSSQINEKSSTNGTNGGVTGTGQTDVPTYPAGTDNNSGKSEESSRTFNYDFNKIKEEIESQPFYVQDLTLSVGLDSSAGNVTPEMKTAVEKMLASLVATSLANNGRTLTTEELASKVTVFDQSFAASAASAAAARNNWLLYGAIGLGVAALAAAGGFVIASRRRKAKQAAEEEAEAAAAAAAPAKVEFPTIDLDHITNDNQARKQLEQLAKKKPEEFVNLLRTWLVDE